MGSNELRLNSICFRYFIVWVDGFSQGVGTTFPFKTTNHIEKFDGTTFLCCPVKKHFVGENFKRKELRKPTLEKIFLFFRIKPFN